MTSKSGLPLAFTDAEIDAIVGRINRSHGTAALMRRLQALVRTHGPDVPRDRTDVVHFDFHTSNILATAERITGVIDWEAAHDDDRSFDPVNSGRSAAIVYAAHLVHRSVEWCVRFHPGRVDANMSVGTALLDHLEGA